MSNKTFYGWRIVGAGSAFQFMQSMLLNQAFGAYVAVLVEEQKWSKTSLSAAAALKSTETAILGPALGWGVDKWGAQGIIRIGCVLFGIGFMLLSVIDTLLQFYAAFVVLSLGASMCSNFPISVAIIQWFEKRRARALSIVQFGMALGGIFVFVVAWCMEAFGWRATAFGSGVIIIVVGWPLSGIFRSRPEDHGEHIDGLPPAPPKAGAPAAAPARPAFTPREALRTSAFWLISLGHAFSLLVVSAINVHAMTHIKEGLGYTLAQASVVITLVTVGQFFGVAIGWAIGDRFIKRKIAAVCMLMHCAGLLLLTDAAGPIILGLAAIIHGIGWGLRGPFMQAIRADYFGHTSIGMIIGLSALITVFGQIGGPMIAGVLADWTGDYRTGFTVLALMAGVGSLFFWIVRRPKKLELS